MISRWKSVLAVTVFISLCGAIFAQSEGLYGAAPDDSASFVRVLNATSAPELADARVGPNRFEPAGLFSPYQVVRPGIYVVSAAGSMGELIAGEGEFATIVVTDSGIAVHTDPRHVDPARAQLLLYTPGASLPTSLVTSDGAVTVISSVEPGSASEVVVNAVTVGLSVVTEEEILGSPDPVALRRGQSYGFVVLPEGRSPRVQWARAAVRTE